MNIESILRPSSLLTLVIAAMLPVAVQAHRAWMLPSSTVVSSQNAYVTIDAASSNDLFYFDHRPMRLDQLKVTAPDGSMVNAENQSTGAYRSTFDVKLAQQGTYRISVGSPERRVETFVTAGKPTTQVLQPSGSGFEFAPVTHPNDLFAGENAEFRFLWNGKPVEGVQVSVIPGGIRYRDQLGETTFKSDKDGKVSVKWPAAGMYWLTARIGTQQRRAPGAQQGAGAPPAGAPAASAPAPAAVPTPAPADNEPRGSYSVTLEVLAQ